ncbi:MAG TPA: porin [Thermoanaerobaculia bacterium]|jgi:phosphate-selective porin
MKAAVLTLLLLTPTLHAQTVEERLAKLEAEVRELREENRDLRARLGVKSEIKPVVAVQPVGRETKLAVGGLIQAQAEAGGRVDARFSDDNDRLFLRRARLNAQGAFAEHFDFKVELDLAGSLSAASGLRGQATDAHLTWNRHPSAKVRIGQFKAPFGYETLFSDSVLATPERTLGSDRLALGRQIGVQLFGDFPQRRVAYAVGAFNGTGTNTSLNDDEGFVAAARLSGTILDREPLRWSAGVNGFRGDDRNAAVAPELGFANNVFRGERDAFGVDTQFVAGPFELWLERLQSRFDPEAGNAREATSHMVFGIWSVTGRIQAVARWDELEANGNELTTWTVGTNYLIKGNDLKLQLHWLKSDDDSRVIARMQTIF